jgi:hypothetical protein
MMLADYGLKTQKHLQAERQWVNQMMAGDDIFWSLQCVHRDYLRVRRHFVQWTIKNGEPVLDALLIVNQIGMTDQGLWADIEIATLGDPRTKTFRITHMPRLTPLGVYLWIPAHAEVRYTPTDYSNVHSTWSISIPLLAKTMHNAATGQFEGSSYFASKDEFIALWSNHNF